MKFQVIVPPLEEDGFQVTLSVEGKNWMGALRTALSKIGEGAEHIQNINCDVLDDGSFKVTDMESQRVFLIKQASEKAASPAKTANGEVKAAKQAKAREKAAEAKEKAAREKAAREKREQEAAAKTAKEQIKKQKLEEQKRKAQEKPQIVFRAKKVGEAEKPKRTKTSQTERSVPKTRTPEPQKRPAQKTRQKTIETRLGEGGRAGTDTVELLTDVFESTMDLFSITRTQKAVDFILKEALNKIPSEAGSILFNDLGKRDLVFVAAKGPKAEELIGRRIPLGKGIVGAAVLNHVCLSIPDVTQDPRWDKSISESVSFQTKSLLCAPMFLEGRCYGAIELINRKKPGRYTRKETSVAIYLAEQLARWLSNRGK